jgi:hypothetical protein
MAWTHGSNRSSEGNERALRGASLPCSVECALFGVGLDGVELTG